MNTKDLVVNPMLTNFALGYKNAAYVSEKIFPEPSAGGPHTWEWIRKRALPNQAAR